MHHPRRYAVRICLGWPGEIVKPSAQIDVLASCLCGGYEAARAQARQMARRLLEWAEEPVDLLETAIGCEPYYHWLDYNPETGTMRCKD